MRLPIKKRAYYSSCEDLPLFNWVKLVVTGDVEWLFSEPLKKWHKPTDLTLIWEKIFTEYTELTNDVKANHVLSMIKGITVINNKLQIIQSAINLLAKARPMENYQPIIKMLKEFGFRYSFTEETIFEDLKRTASSAKRMVITRDQLQKDYETFGNSDQKATEKDYYLMIAELSKFLGFPIDAKKTTVLSYISYVEQYHNSIKHERAANQRNSISKGQ